MSLGDIVAMTPSDEDSADAAAPQMAMIQALWQAPKAKMMQVEALQCEWDCPSSALLGNTTELIDVLPHASCWAAEDWELQTCM